MQWEGNWYDTEDWPKNQYRYNGKELNSDFGLDWYAYGARWYEPGIGRWNAVDPLAEEYYSVSSYSYVLNNPLIYIDPFGLNVYGLDVVTGGLTLIEETDEDTHTIHTGTTNRKGEFSMGVDGYVKSITFGKGVSNIDEVVDGFGDASAGGLVFSGGEEAYYEGLNVMEFISFESHIELSAWTFDSDEDLKIDGIYINRWDENDNASSYDFVDLYSDKVNDASHTRDHLGQKVYHIHTHPGTRGREGGFGEPSESDKQTSIVNAKYPHYILSRIEGTVRYKPKGIR